MILIKKATFEEVPLLSLKGWKIHGTPITEQCICENNVNVQSYQPMIKEIEITKEYEEDILEYLNYMQMKKHLDKDYNFKLIYDTEIELFKNGCSPEYIGNQKYTIDWESESQNS